MVIVTLLVYLLSITDVMWITWKPIPLIRHFLVTVDLLAITSISLCKDVFLIGGPVI